MALSAQLGGAGMTASRLETTATISLEKVGDGFAITKSHLDLVAQIPGADKAKFDAAVKARKPAARYRNSSRQKSTSAPGCNPRTQAFSRNVLTGRFQSTSLPDIFVLLPYRMFSSKGSNRYNAAHDSSSRSFRCRCGDLSDRALGRVRGHHPAAARHAKVPPRSPFLPLDLEGLEIRDVLHP